MNTLDRQEYEQSRSLNLGFINWLETTICVSTSSKDFLFIQTQLLIMNSDILEIYFKDREYANKLDKKESKCSSEYSSSQDWLLNLRAWTTWRTCSSISQWKVNSPIKILPCTHDWLVWVEYNQGSTFPFKWSVLSSMVFDDQWKS